MATVHHSLRVVPPRKTQVRRPVGRRLLRVGLGVFFASVAANAALGIYAVLGTDFGETQGKMLVTSLCVTGVALLALVCEPAWERLLLGPVPYMGAVLGALGFGLVIVGVWAEPETDVLGKTTGSIMVVAVALAAASLMSLARLAPRHQWVLALTLGLLALGAALVAVAPWLGGDPSEWYLRGMGAVLIALAAFVLSVPVVHWVDRSTLRVAASVSPVRYCPYCGTAIAGTARAVLSCRRCGRDFTVT